VGTPPYISPEQASGNGAPNLLSDIHVLGSILYAILTLRAPILSHDVDEVIKAVSQNKFIPVSEMVHTPGHHGTPPPSLAHCPGGRPPEGLVAVVEKAMHFDPTQRYQSVEELQEDITAWQNGFATKAEHAGFFRQLLLLLSRRRKEATGALIFAAILFGASAYFLRQLSEDRATLQSANQRFESLILQLRASADGNYQDAKAFLSRGLPKNALEQINLALVGAEESSVQKAAFLTLRGHCNMALGSYSEALQDYQKAYQILPNALPLDIIETDLNLENIDEARPPGGWSWEHIQLSPEKAASFKKSLPRKYPK
jgi:tetratricopeptide (TPR) repeat protein